MCGIAGKLLLRSDGRVPVEDVRRMCAALRHRGPDDDGTYVDGPVGLGMRRLSIIDLVTGHQPIHDEARRVWTVYNGEIYNFPDLRRTLEGRGHRFYTNTDTEVIVHLYEDHGEDFVQHLQGMFAIALWDARDRKLFLARDRLGIKPLYYYQDAGRLLFGSELKAILADDVPRQVDAQALHDYLSLSYVPGPRTIFTHISKLPPAHLLTVRNGVTRLVRYWQLRYPPAGSGAPRDAGAAAEELHELLRTTVKQHLLSDVPLGVFLSGGVDSSSLVALMRQVSTQPVRTFSVGFEEASYDELDYARTVARAFETEHHELVLRPSAVDLVPQLVRAFDEPFADSSAIPVYCVARLARRHVTVALSGEGGDEVFAGYHTYAAYKVARLYQRLPAALARRIIPALIDRLPVSDRRVSFDYKAKRFVHGALLPPADAHYAWKMIMNEDTKAALRADGLDGMAATGRLYRAAYERAGHAEALTRLQHIDLSVYLPDDILVKADRMTMAVSLEARVPFLDHRVVEWAAALPSSLKVRGLSKKYVLKRAMAPYLPARILRGRKRGFNVPIPIWLRHDLRDFVHDVLSPARVRDAGFFDPEVVGAMLDDHARRRSDQSRSLWCLLMFMLWREEYLGPPRAVRSEPPTGRSHEKATA